MSDVVKMGLQTCMLRNGGTYDSKLLEKEFENANFKASMLPAITLGAYIGVIFNARIHQFTMNKSHNIKTISVFIACLIVISLWFFLFFFFSKSFSVYALYIFGFAPPMTLLTFILFSEFEKFFVMKYIEKQDMSPEINLNA